MPPRLLRSFSPPPPNPVARGCLAAIVAAGATLFAGAGLCTLVAGSYALAHASRPSQPIGAMAPSNGAVGSSRAARRVWGEIRAAYRLKHLLVPA